MATMVASRGCATATRRACDVCSTRSALWYCAADEGYLCTACDTQVHSANAVSLRHERVRLAPSCTVPKKKLLQHEVPYSEDASSRKRPSSQPYSHHLRKLTRLSNQLVEDKHRHQAELELFDFLDADSEFFLDQEVPSLGATESCSRGSDELECVDDQDGDSLAAFFKGKAAAMHSQTVNLINSDDDQFRLVPVDDAALFDHFDVPADTHVDAGDAFFFPGDIPGLESFAVPEMDLVDDFSLSCFDLALQNGLDAFEGNNNNGGADNSGASECKTKPTAMTTTTTTDFLAGPFAKFFAQKSKMTEELPMDPEMIKREARAMLQCCNGEDEARVPSLQLNMKDVLAAWSDREEPWIVGCDDAGLVPDLDCDRDARVLRYKEKRRNRLFSKTIRYEVRKLNAERRPRMKGRFVKRTTTTATTATICS